MIAVLAAVLLTGCEKDVMPEGEPSGAVAFHVVGDFGNPVFTRALSASGSATTELWAFDFVDGEFVDYVYQTNEDDDFGIPALTMTNGEHTVCFVVSRGDGYTIDDSENVLEWDRPSDTFWGSVTVNVSPTSERDVTVTLNRVATKIRVAVADEVPENLSQIVITPHTWYYGLNYWTGEAVAPKTDYPRAVSVPSSLHGTSGQLAVSIFGLSDVGEWNTDVTVTANDGDGAISSVTIADAPFMANRQTGYSGRLFGNRGAFSLTLYDAWGDEYVGTW